MDKLAEGNDSGLKKGGMICPHAKTRLWRGRSTKKGGKGTDEDRESLGASRGETKLQKGEVTTTL